MKMESSKSLRKSRKKPERHHYSTAFVIALVIVLLALGFYLASGFSSVRQSIVELEKNPRIKSVFYRAGENKLFVECENGKKIEIRLEESIKKYTPVVSDFCR